MPRISVELVIQRTNNDCVPACIMMMLGWMRKKYEGSPILTYEQVVDAVEWKERSGTKICNVVKIHDLQDVKKSRFQPKFYCSPATTPEAIWDQIDEGRPIIAYLLVERLDSMMQHAVLVNGYSEDRTKIMYMDPLDGPIEKLVGVFIEEWERLRMYIVHVVINEVTDLTKYIAESEE